MGLGALALGSAEICSSVTLLNVVSVLNQLNCSSFKCGARLNDMVTHFRPEAMIISVRLTGMIVFSVGIYMVILFGRTGMSITYASA